MLSRFESPKLRLPPKLPSKPWMDPNKINKEERDDDDDDDEGMWDRQFAMSQSMKLLKMKKGKEAKGAAGTLAAAGDTAAGAK